MYRRTFITPLGGEAALRAGMILKENILALASAITQTRVEALIITKVR